MDYAWDYASGSNSSDYFFDVPGGGEEQNKAFLCEAVTKGFNFSASDDSGGNVAEAFHNTPSIADGHLRTPRFGHTSNLTQVVASAVSGDGGFDDSGAQAYDYLVGLISASIGIFCVFLVWIITLGVFWWFTSVRARRKQPAGTAREEHDGDGEDDPQLHQLKLKEESNSSGTRDDGPERTMGGELTKKKVAINTPGSATTKLTVGAAAGGSHDNNNLSESSQKHKERLEESIEEGGTKGVAEQERGEEVEVVDLPTTTLVETSTPSTIRSFTEFHDNEDSSRGNESGGVEEEGRNCRHDHRTSPSSLHCIRIAIAICGLCVVTLCVLMVYFGVDQLYGTLKQTRNGIDQAQALSLKGVDAIDNFVNTYNATASAARDLDASGYCPQVREAVCDEIPGPFGTCVLTGIADQLDSMMAQSSQFVFGQAESIRPDLIQTATMLGEINDDVGKFNWAFYVSGAAAVLLAILNVIIVVGVVFQEIKISRKATTAAAETESSLSAVSDVPQKWFIVPLYIVSVIISWIFFAVFLIGTTATADFCYDSPNRNVLTILREFQMEEYFKSEWFKYMEGYVSGCRDFGLPEELKLAAVAFQIGLGGVIDVANFMVDNSFFAASVCLVGPRATLSGAEKVRQLSCDLAAAAYDLVDFFDCGKWNALYTKVFYHSVCYEGTRGMSWMALTQLLVVFFSAVMLTLCFAFCRIRQNKDVDGDVGRRGANTDPIDEERKAESSSHHDSDHEQHP